ncbi:hypothetical protein P175DRAFT_0529569 [Aspergillus ochraceoroseus IBT 24754]|uniref:Uncharacterized protein n=1 Tax=Aspergillus ochraceoroseus IBT 24754 TaxID=1392256 RepID=A0A2T5M1V0_9EURO|nr:uncharacterized protein P175DRAFT_0529569 [Aspergillus ochraceoroseus IBT 24754]PTU22505.1 hypothetical protein P175DRAFT_0529569 [Aspergillus ochraceoroseus IBT 24754]
MAKQCSLLTTTLSRISATPKVLCFLFFPYASGNRFPLLILAAISVHPAVVPIGMSYPVASSIPWQKRTNG